MFIVRDIISASTDASNAVLKDGFYFIPSIRIIERSRIRKLHIGFLRDNVACVVNIYKDSKNNASNAAYSQGNKLSLLHSRTFGATTVNNTTPNASIIIEDEIDLFPGDEIVAALSVSPSSQTLTNFLTLAISGYLLKWEA